MYINAWEAIAHFYLKASSSNRDTGTATGRTYYLSLPCCTAHTYGFMIHSLKKKWHVSLSVYGLLNVDGCIWGGGGGGGGKKGEKTHNLLLSLRVSIIESEWVSGD